MVKLFYSKDPGLLDFKAFMFKREVGVENVKHIIKPSIRELELLMFHMNSDDYFENLIIENFDGNMDILSSVLDNSHAENVLILTNKKPDGEILRYIHNKDVEIKPLNKITRKTFINNLIKHKYGNCPLPKEMIKDFKNRVISSATTIDEVLGNLTALHKQNMLDQKTFEELVRNVPKEVNKNDFFKFWEVYLSESECNWMILLYDIAQTNKNFKRLIRALPYQLLEFKKYISARKLVGTGSKKISEFTKSPMFVAAIYKESISRFSKDLNPWFDDFVFEWFLLVKDFQDILDVNLELLRTFLVKKRINLIHYI